MLFNTINYTKVDSVMIIFLTRHSYSVIGVFFSYFGWNVTKSLFHNLQKISYHQMSNLWQCFQFAKRVWRDVVGNLLKPPPAPNFCSPSSLITGHLTLASHTFLLSGLNFFSPFWKRYGSKVRQSKPSIVGQMRGILLSNRIAPNLGTNFLQKRMVEAKKVQQIWQKQHQHV